MWSVRKKDCNLVLLYYFNSSPQNNDLSFHGCSASVMLYASTLVFQRFSPLALWLISGTENVNGTVKDVINSYRESSSQLELAPKGVLIIEVFCLSLVFWQEWNRKNIHSYRVARGRAMLVPIRGKKNKFFLSKEAF